jgi:hypothetical protein
MSMTDTTEGFASTDFDLDDLKTVMGKFPTATSSSQIYIGRDLMGQNCLMPSTPKPTQKKPAIHREPIPYGSSVGVWVTAAAIVTVVAFMAIAG